MMNVTYLSHSGFVLEFEQAFFVFDYYRGEVPEFDRDKELYVFSSHAHYDHFKKGILDWDEKYPGTAFIFSDDIKAKVGKHNITFVGPREEIIVGSCRIRTFRSTDEGVAFLVYYTDKVIYHAGDLNWWHWEEESAAYNEMMKRNYQYEIGKFGHPKIDVAFVPVDGRLGAQYYWGLDYFMRHTDTKKVFPMHFFGDYSVCDKLMKEEATKDYRDRIVKVSYEGEQFLGIDE